jgi:hypothetical protein
MCTALGTWRGCVGLDVHKRRPRDSFIRRYCGHHALRVLSFVLRVDRENARPPTVASHDYLWLVLVTARSGVGCMSGQVSRHAVKAGHARGPAHVCVCTFALGEARGIRVGGTARMRDVAVACDCFRLPGGHMTSSGTQWSRLTGACGALPSHAIENLLHVCSVNSPSLF